MAEDAEIPAPERPISELEADDLVQRLRAGAKDREVLIAHAYRVLFRSELGRVVLIDHLQECGVGRPDGPGKRGKDLQYGAGMRDAALRLAGQGGYGELSMTVMALSDHLAEETSDERPIEYVASGDDDF